MMQRTVFCTGCYRNRPHDVEGDPDMDGDGIQTCTSCGKVNHGGPAHEVTAPCHKCGKSIPIHRVVTSMSDVMCPRCEEAEEIRELPI